MTASTELTSITCPECAGVYAISAFYHEEASRVGGFKLCWTCPYCRTKRGFGKGSDQQKVEELERKLQWEAEKARHEHDRRQIVENSLRTTKGVVTKLKKRAAAGVCPCCNRTFSQLARHMAEKHPEFAQS